MANIIPRKRCSFRLPTTTTQQIDAQRGRKTKSAYICACLSKLVHDLQTERVPGPLIAELADRDSTRQHRDRDITYVRVPVILYDYLTFNCYNLTACIIAAVNIYGHGRDN